MCVFISRVVAVVGRGWGVLVMVGFVVRVVLPHLLIFVKSGGGIGGGVIGGGGRCIGEGFGGGGDGGWWWWWWWWWWSSSQLSFVRQPDLGRRAILCLAIRWATLGQDVFSPD